MDIKVPDSWLREYLKTKAAPEKIAECVSLCGPSIERVREVEGETVYEIEVTGNRVDSASVMGIAMEAAAILPEFDIKAEFVGSTPEIKASKDKMSVEIIGDEDLAKRIVAREIMGITTNASNSVISKRIGLCDQRPVNLVVDITNYVMFGMGIPLHAMDLDKLPGKTLVLRRAKKGEKATTLDGRTHTMNGHEIVFLNKDNEIIDIPGVMGCKNTMVTEDTKNILLIAEHIDPLSVRETSLTHELRTFASVINEKTPPVSRLRDAVNMATALIVENAKPKAYSSLFDEGRKETSKKGLTINHSTINESMGVEIPKKDVTRILTNLGFSVETRDEAFFIIAPEARSQDINIPEDIIEEIARIYGYFRLPSVLPTGELPKHDTDPVYAFESLIKTKLSGWGGVEVYTLSMTSKEKAGEGALQIRNPLGEDGSYMRTTLTPSLLSAGMDNVQEKSPFHLFEIANVYIPNKKATELPQEVPTLAGVFMNTDFRVAKGILEALFEVLHIEEPVKLRVQGSAFTYEYSIHELMGKYKPFVSYETPSKYPSQIEDITIVMTENVTYEIVSKAILKAHKFVKSVSLNDVYENAYTFRVQYHSSEKTLDSGEVSNARESIMSVLHDIGLEIK